MRKIFIAATKQNDGKTTVSLGIIRNLQQKFGKVGFIKPIFCLVYNVHYNVHKSSVGYTFV